MVLMARFDSPDAARANAARPELGAWWSATEDLLEGSADFLETGDVNVQPVKDASRSGFVQLMRARVRDRGRLEAIEAEVGPAFFELRPDFLDGYRAWLPDGSLAAVDYFNSVAEARAGEAREMPDHLTARFQEWMALLEGTGWYDLTEPLLAAPG
ncbi:MAG: hypothetical protein M3P85_15625 [Actinomycetota bacterium]|nr:hypothetical protein [Actinomycetota bacterium]